MRYCDATGRRSGMRASARRRQEALSFAKNVVRIVCAANGAADPSVGIRVMGDDGQAEFGKVFLSPRIVRGPRVGLVATAAHEAGHSIRVWHHRLQAQAEPIAAALSIAMFRAGWISVLAFLACRVAMRRIIIRRREYEAWRIAASVFRTYVLRDLVGESDRDFEKVVTGYPSNIDCLKMLSRSKEIEAT